VQEPNHTLPGTNPNGTLPGTNPSQPDVTNPQSGENKKPRKIVRPVAGETVLEYAMDCLCYNPTTRDWRVHNGIDIAAQEGTEVLAAADGQLYAVFEDELLGTTVVIRHENDYTTRYSSLHPETKVTPGQDVVSGQVIGTVGKSAMMEYAIGEHVHFSVSLNGAAVNPEEFLAQN
jgi:murein DD-endopeptidase MepM/ murein hydrolase activator NlpD